MASGSTAGAHTLACSPGIEVVAEFDIAVGMAVSCLAVDAVVVFVGKKSCGEKGRS